MINLLKDKDAPIQLSLTQAPKQLPIQNNATLHISAGVQIKNYTVPRNIRVEVDVSKKILFWVKIPCFGCDFSLSCDKMPEICMVNDFCKDCSVNVRNIKVRMPADIEQQLPRFLPNFVINGHYWARLRLINKDKPKETVACIEVETDVKSHAKKK
ncbi:uncharacterized protein [Clytia hemisphaerica]|uniref:uncharacterized protein isoform X2 n=1 Tax=Clytia hemisphaerica TaxID=252671 RepID=UPI0034D4A680